MVGSAAVVGWARGGGEGACGPGLTQQYYLGGTDSARCPPVSDRLDPAENVSVIVTAADSRLYLAFQIYAGRPQPYLIYAVGPKYDLPSAASGYYLSEHRNAMSVPVSYTITKAASVSRGGSGFSLARWHGLLVLLGWDVLMSIGVAVARYFKHYDPHWFYTHSFIQGIGFLSGLVGIVIGFGLVNNVDAHRALGIAILVLGSFQVMTLLARPDRASKARRKYWNWCHHWVGRAVIAGVIGNISFGLVIARENNSWNIAYRVFSAVWIITCVFLEVRKHKSPQ